MSNLRHSIIIKLLAAFLAAGLLMAFAMMLVQGKLHFDVLYEKQRVEYEELSRNASDAIDSLLQEYKNAITQLSYVQELNCGDRDEVGKTLKNYLSRSLQGFIKLYYVDADGNMYSSSEVVLETLRKTLNYDVPLQLANATPTNGAAVISDVYRSSMITANTVAVSRRNATGGIAIGELSFDAIQEQIELVCGTWDVKYLLLSGSSKVICSNLPKSMKPQDIVDRLSGKDEGWTNYTGEDQVRYRLFSSSGFRKCDWELVIIIDETSVYTSLLMLMRTNLVVSALLMIGMIAVLAVIAWHFIKPIRLLSRSIQSTETPQADVFLNEKRKDEIGDLSRSIGTMLQHIDRMTETQAEIQKKRFEAEKRALQNQIAPHFLYNSLNMLSSLAMSGGQDKIPMAVSALVHLLLLSTEKTAPYDTLGDEVKCASEYMDIMRLRYEKKYELSINVADELKDLLVIKLLILPIIENSIYHGLVQTGREGLVIIEAFVEDDMLMISVMDNGCGMDEHKAEKLLSGDQDSEIRSTGLANTDARIKLYFGDEYGLSVRSKVGIGTRIMISLPVIHTVDEWEAKSNENRL